MRPIFYSETNLKSVSRPSVCRWHCSDKRQEQERIVELHQCTKGRTDIPNPVTRSVDGQFDLWHWYFISSGVFCHITRWLVPDLSKQHSGLIFRGLYWLDFRHVKLDQYFMSKRRELFSSQQFIKSQKILTFINTAENFKCCIWRCVFAPKTKP